MKHAEWTIPGSPTWSWVKLGLFAVPLLGLGILFFAPWLLPGPPAGDFAITPLNPLEVGDRLVGPVMYTLDARALNHWTFFDFSRGSVVEVPHQFSLAWDLAFQRHKIIANGGATNPKGKGAILNLGGVGFEAVTEAPADGYLTDTIAAIGPERIETENLAIKAWYRYNFITHLLRAKPNVYVIRTAAGKFAKVRIVSYYCEGGNSSGCFTFEYVYQGDGSRRFAPAY